MLKVKDLPLVSIITPSFNQADYLEETIRSVLEQDYPNLEYLVIDGASTDGSVEIIRRYEKEITWWASEPDQGQADAINKGLAHAKGEIVAWLNSDDIYRPGAIRAAVDALQENPDLGLVYGQLDSIDSAGNTFNTISYQPYDLLDLLSFRIIGQPAVFMRRIALQRAGELDPSYHYLLDHQLWLRIGRESQIHYLPQVLAAARHHPAAKNVAHASAFGEEAFRIMDWAREQPGLRPIIDKNKNRVRAGAFRLAARYQLDGGQAARSLGSYARAFIADPSYTLKHAERILYALLSLLGFGWLRRFRRGESADRRPILVTGLHRSGTTWLGRMLALSGELAYISEPLNVWHRRGVLDAHVQHWYTYINEENEQDFLPAFADTLALRYHFWRELVSLRSARDFLRMLRDSLIFGWGRLTRRRALLKDPFALFSAPWFAERLDAQVVIVLRHPAAFVSSLKRLGWSFGFDNLLAQPTLMRDYLEPFRADMEKSASQSDDLIDRASLLWRMNAHVVHQLQTKYPQFYIVKHEELSRNPVKGFKALYLKLGLPFTSRVERGILRATAAKNPEEASLNSIYSTKLDSAASLDNWKQRLSEDEIQRIRQLTKDESGLFYGDEDWV